MVSATRRSRFDQLFSFLAHYYSLLLKEKNKKENKEKEKKEKKEKDKRKDKEKAS